MPKLSKSQWDRLTAHADRANKLKDAVDDYRTEIVAVEGLERHDVPIDIFQKGLDLLDLDKRDCEQEIERIITNGWSKALAASPGFGGPATRPYRIVLLKLSDASFVVARVYSDDLGGRDSGHYFKKEQYAEAMTKWLELTQYEIAERSEACWVMNPLCSVNA